jgi:hypothetical protein
MSTNVLRVRPRRAAAVCTSSRAILRALQGFSRPYRRQVARMAGRHPALADLAVTFPGLLFTLAVPRSGVDQACAIALVTDCAPLKAAAAAAGVPFWLRRLPPEAFVMPIGPLPDGENFRCRIANHLPLWRTAASAWLSFVSDAARWGDEEFTIWVASKLSRDRRPRNRLRRPELLALFAWHSRQPETSASRHIRTPWQPSMSVAEAFAAADDWRATIDLRVAVGDAPLEPWVEARSALGFDFVPLNSWEVVAEEAIEMRNCLRTYGPCLANRWGQLWSIRRQGKRVATIAVGFYRNEPFPRIYELYGPNNVPAETAVWRAAVQWCDESRLIDIEPQYRERNDEPLSRSIWIELWKPYWLAKRRIPRWLPLVPSRDTLSDL